MCRTARINDEETARKGAPIRPTVTREPAKAHAPDTVQLDNHAPRCTGDPSASDQVLHIVHDQFGRRMMAEADRLAG